MFSSMQYPHWMIVGGVVLVMIGLVGVALRKNDEEVQADEPPHAAEAQENNPSTVSFAAARIVRRSQYLFACCWLLALWSVLACLTIKGRTTVWRVVVAQSRAT